MKGELVRHRLLGRVYSGPVTGVVTNDDGKWLSVIRADGKLDIWLKRDCDHIQTWWLALADIGDEECNPTLLRRSDDRSRAESKQGWNYSSGRTVGLFEPLICGTGATREEAVQNCQANWDLYK